MDIQQLIEIKPDWAYGPYLYAVQSNAEGNKVCRCGCKGIIRRIRRVLCAEQRKYWVGGTYGDASKSVGAVVWDSPSGSLNPQTAHGSSGRSHDLRGR